MRRDAAERIAPDALAQLHDDPDLRVRFVVADRAPHEIAVRLINDPDEEVALRAKERMDAAD